MGAANYNGRRISGTGIWWPTLPHFSRQILCQIAACQRESHERNVTTWPRNSGQFSGFWIPVFQRHWGTVVHFEAELFFLSFRFSRRSDAWNGYFARSRSFVFVNFEKCMKIVCCRGRYIVSLKLFLSVICASRNLWFRRLYRSLNIFYRSCQDFWISCYLLSFFFGLCIDYKIKMYLFVPNNSARHIYASFSLCINFYYSYSENNKKPSR